MKEHTCRNLASITLGLLLFVGVTLFSGVASATKQEGALTDAEMSVSGEMRTGQLVTVFFDLKGYQIPNGSYPSINVRFKEKPEGNEAQVKAGYPRTTLVFPTSGTYKITIILNEISKPSCGGVDAKVLLEKTIEIQIAE